MKRECGSCTKCCEGYLTGSAYNRPFYPGNPCHFVSIGKKCGIYATRPKDPCISYSCQWLVNEDIPEWFKPDAINAIITKRKFDDANIEYLDLIEAGENLDANVLSWLIMYSLNNKINLRWVVRGAAHWIGSDEFLAEMDKKKTK